jgi:hypothetical protein
LTLHTSSRHFVPNLGPDCFCVQVDGGKLRASLRDDLGEALALQITDDASTWFARSPVFVTNAQLELMRAAVASLWRSAPSLPDQPAGAFSDNTASGVLYGFDFHLGAAGPRLIEVNTNAGGVLLGVRLAQAQLACCDEIALRSTALVDPQAVEQRLLEMFRQEWSAARPPGAHAGQPSCIAIVDDTPPSQGLYPEMQLYRALFERAGIRSFLLDPSQLTGGAAGLEHAGSKIDLVYNRLTDFELMEPAHAPLREAWRAGSVVLTPHPDAYLALADKRRLVQLSDRSLLEEVGVPAADRQLLEQIVPATSLVQAEASEALWCQRKQLFFKPVQGYGSRGAYDGRKLTRKVFAHIVSGEWGPYVAQERVEPSEQVLELREGVQRFKVDLRAVAYESEVVFFLARLYRGQTTNLRTVGGGLATVFPAPD